MQTRTAQPDLHITAALLLAAATLFSACAEPVQARASGQVPLPAAAPATRSAQLQELETVLPEVAAAEYIGVLVPEQAADVVAPQAGMINTLHAALGEVVNAGQLLVSMSMEQASLEHQRAVAERDAARAALDRARNEQSHAFEESERNQSLAGEGLVTQEQLAQARFKVGETRALAWEAESRLAERAARAEQLLVLRDQTRVTASFRGRVAVRYLSAGARVAAGTPLLRLISDGALLVRFAVPEQDTQLQVGSSVELVPVEQPEHSFSARVQRIAPEIDSASRMRTLEAVPLQSDTLQLTEAGLIGAIVRVRPLARPGDST